MSLFLFFALFVLVLVMISPPVRAKEKTNSFFCQIPNTSGFYST